MDFCPNQSDVTTIDSENPEYVCSCHPLLVFDGLVTEFQKRHEGWDVYIEDSQLVEVYPENAQQRRKRNTRARRETEKAVKGLVK
jgi:hypothetical protein